MENTQIKNIEDLQNWIEKHSEFCIIEKGEDYFTIQGHCDSLLTIHFDKQDSSLTTLCKTIGFCEDFNADDEFDAIWGIEFQTQNRFRPSEFLRMLMSDEEDFHNLAKELREIVAKQNINR